MINQAFRKEMTVAGCSQFEEVPALVVPQRNTKEAQSCAEVRSRVHCKSYNKSAIIRQISVIRVLFFIYRERVAR
tara:strand:+ start:4231 stop:4455 length:225 start_codon:yes stop_codon:yes gene_type:complete